MNDLSFNELLNINSKNPDSSNIYRELYITDTNDKLLYTSKLENPDNEGKYSRCSLCFYSNDGLIIKNKIVYKLIYDENNIIKDRIIERITDPHDKDIIDNFFSVYSKEFDEGIYRIVEYKDVNNILKIKSELKDKKNDFYEKCYVTFYNNDGTIPLKTEVYKLMYHNDGRIYEKELIEIKEV